jgi:pyruvate/oxaloacetate carboxyltransferase
MSNKDRKCPIKNDEQVLAITENGIMLPYLFGQLKQDFQNHKIKQSISSIMCCRTKIHYLITIKPTQGIYFVRMGSK